MKKFITTIGLLIVPVIVLLLLGVFILKIGTIATFFSGVLFMATALNQHMGMNIWLARAITAPLLFFGYYYGLRNILSFRGNRAAGYGTLIGVWCVICLSMYVSQGSFSRTTGEAVKYYFRDYKGQIVLRDYSGFDAETQAKLEPVTPEIIKEYQLQQDGTLKITDETIFDPKTGKPLKRYYKEKNGTITLFPIDVEYHPEYGTKLEVVTPEIAKQLRQENTSLLQKSDHSRITQVKLINMDFEEGLEDWKVKNNRVTGKIVSEQAFEGNYSFKAGPSNCSGYCWDNYTVTLFKEFSPSVVIKNISFQVYEVKGKAYGGGELQVYVNQKLMKTCDPIPKIPKNQTGWILCSIDVNATVSLIQLKFYDLTNVQPMFVDSIKITM